MAEKKAAEEKEPTYIPARKAAKRLGVEYRTLLAWCKNGKVPHFKPDRRVYIPSAFLQGK